MSNDEITKARGVAEQAGPPPGPPPRQGLEWRGQTHRWFRPENDPKSSNKMSDHLETQLKVIETEFFSKYQHAKVEHAVVIDNQGKVIVSNVGDADKVAFSAEEVRMIIGASELIHNHPFGAGSFSPGDLISAYEMKVRRLVLFVGNHKLTLELGNLGRDEVYEIAELIQLIGFRDSSKSQVAAKTRYQEAKDKYSVNLHKPMSSSKCREVKGKIVWQEWLRATTETLLNLGQKRGFKVTDEELSGIEVPEFTYDLSKSQEEVVDPTEDGWVLDDSGMWPPKELIDWINEDDAEEADEEELKKARGVPTMAGPAPGPPPRPGLVWNDDSHRWLRPEDAALRDKVLETGQYSSEEFRKNVRSLSPDEQLRLGKHICWETEARQGAYFSNMDRKVTIQLAKYIDKEYLTDMNDPNFMALEGAAEDMMRHGSDPEARKIAYKTCLRHPIPKSRKFIEESYGRSLMTGDMVKDIDSAVSGYEATAAGPQANWLNVAVDKIFNGVDAEHNELGSYSYRFPEHEYYDVVKKLYDQTQEFYKKKGITHITLHRGLTKERGEVFRLRDSDTLTSWTTDKTIATFHAKRGYLKDRHYSAYIVNVNMPVENILYSYETVPQLKTKTFRDVLDEDKEFVVIKRKDQKLFKDMDADLLKTQGVPEQAGPPPGPPPAAGLVWESTSHRWKRPEEIHQPNRFYPMLASAAPTYSKKLDEVFDSMTDEEKKDVIPYIKFMNLYAKLIMDQYEDKPITKVTNRLWEMISSNAEANTLMERTIGSFDKDVDKANAGNEFSQVYLIDGFIHAWHTEGGLNVWKTKLPIDVRSKVTSVFRDIFDELAGEKGEGYFKKGNTDGQGEKARISPDTDPAEDKPVVRSAFDNIVEFEGRKYVELGNTFRTDIDVEPGAVIEVSAQELVMSQNQLSWDKPRVSGVDLTRATPYTLSTTLSIAQRYENTIIKAEKRSASQDDLEENDEGGRDKFSVKSGDVGVLTIDEHITFLDEDAAREFIGVTSYEAWNSTKQRFSRRVGSLHSDIRILNHGSDFLQGFTATVGGMKERNKLVNNQNGDRVIISSFKAPTSHGKIKWQTDVGQGKVWLFEPGEIGSPGNRWSAIFKVERKAKVTFGKVDDHSIEMKISGTKHMPEGRWVLIHAPVEPNHSEWLLMKPKKQEYEDPLLNTLSKSERKSLLKAVLDSRGK